MKEKLIHHAMHAILALFLSVGFAMPLLGVMNEGFVTPAIIPSIAGMILILEIVSLHRISFAAALVAGVAGAMAWVFSPTGSLVFSDILIALTLRMQGIDSALPLVSEPAVIFVSVLITVVSWLSAWPKATCFPSVMLGTAVVMIIWITDRMEMIVWLLPALAGVLTMILTYRNEGTSVIRVLPWATAVVAAAWMITGGSGMTVKPLKEKADELRQAVLDRLFFTEARDVFSLYAAGFSPQGPDQLGGKPNPDDHPVMDVSCPRTAYLRGTAYDFYDGHAWHNTAGGRRYLWQSQRMEASRTEIFNQNLPPASVQNSLSNAMNVFVRILNDSTSTIFVPQRVRELMPGGEMVPYFSNSSEIFITRNLRAGDTYTVSAPLFTSDDAGIGTLLDICSTFDDPLWNRMPEIYRQLPDHLEKAIYELADRITSAAASPYEKALSIRNYLSRNCRYSLDVGEHPENIDFVTMFLMETRKGYCTYFASAMTVLCRIAGLPARYVEGYLAEPGGNGEVVVTGMDAHAWTEVYFKGFGWLTFDATPHQPKEGTLQGNGAGNNGSVPPPSGPSDEEPSPPPQEDETKPDDTETPDPEPSPTPSWMPPPENPVPPEASDPVTGGFPWWLILILAAIAGLIIRYMRASPTFRERHAQNEQMRMEVWIQEIMDLLRSEGIQRKPGETMIAFMERAERTGPFSIDLISAAQRVSLIQYSRIGATEEDVQLFRETAKMMREDIRVRERVRHAVIRTFVPLKYRNWTRSERRK